MYSETWGEIRVSKDTRERYSKKKIKIKQNKEKERKRSRFVNSWCGVRKLEKIFIYLFIFLYKLYLHWIMQFSLILLHLYFFFLRTWHRDLPAGQASLPIRLIRPIFEQQSLFPSFYIRTPKPTFYSAMYLHVD